MCSTCSMRRCGFWILGVTHVWDGWSYGRSKVTTPWWRLRCLGSLATNTGCSFADPWIHFHELLSGSAGCKSVPPKGHSCTMPHLKVDVESPLLQSSMSALWPQEKVDRKGRRSRHIKHTFIYLFCSIILILPFPSRHRILMKSVLMCIYNVITIMNNYTSPSWGVFDSLKMEFHLQFSYIVGVQLGITWKYWYAVCWTKCLYLFILAYFSIMPVLLR